MENLKSFNFNLQLFAGKGDEELDSEDLDLDLDGDEDTDGEGVVDPEEETDDQEEDSLDDLDEDGEVVDPQESKKQTPDQNAQMKKMRLKATEEANRKIASRMAELEMKAKEIELKESLLTEDAIYERADADGITEAEARKKINEEIKQRVTTELSFHKEKEEAKQDKYYPIIADYYEKLLKSNPTASPKILYKLARDDNFDVILQKELKKTTKKTVADIQDGMRRKPLPSGASGEILGDVGTLSEEGIQMAREMGVDPKRLAKRLKNKTKK